MKLNLWSPLPPSTSGIADYVCEQLPLLKQHLELTLVVEDPAAVDPPLRAAYDVREPSRAPDAELELYHLGNSPAHAFVFRQALRRPGVVVLHDFSLHHLVLRETVERGDSAAYLREMRSAYGEVGSFVGRQVARALGGEMLPALFPLNERLLRQSLGVIGLTAHVVARVKQRLPEGRPLLHLPHHLSLPLDPPPTREEARGALGLPEDALLLTAAGLATASKRLDAALVAVARLREAYPELRLIVAGAVDPQLPLSDWIAAERLDAHVTVTGRLSLADFERHLAAADVLLALRFPNHGEISGALVRGLGVGRPALVSAGSPAAEEFPEGVVVPVDPGRAETEELVALLQKLLSDRALRERIGSLARDHMRRHHDLRQGVLALVRFLEETARGKAAALRAIEAGRHEQGSLLEYLHEELSFGAYDLGLGGLELGADELLAELSLKPR
jgi:glycosyltransferase involved in cell wall biosynthesis